MTMTAKSARARSFRDVRPQAKRAGLPWYAHALELLMAQSKKWLCLEVLQLNRRPIRLADESSPPLHANYQIVELTGEQLRQVSNGPDLDLSSEFLAAAERRGDVCIGVLHNDRLVAYQWFGTGARCPFSAHFRIAYDFPGQAYGYKALTLPMYRGKKLQLLIVASANRILSSRGFSHIIGYVNIENLRSRRMVGKFKHNTAIGWAGCVRFFGHNLRFISPGARRRGFDLVPIPDAAADQSGL